MSQGSDGLGKDSFSDERPQTHSKQGRRGLGVAIVVGAGIFCVVLTVVALLAYYAITQHEPASEPVANENVEAGDASPVEEKSRAERFGFVPVDSGAPFEVEGVRFKLKGHKGDKATIVVEGTLFNRGKNAVDAAVLKATVGVVTEEGQTLSHALKEASFKPRVTRRRTWQPGQSVSFELQADGIPRGDLTEAAVDRFMWLTLEAKNGKSFEYKGTLVEVDIE